MVVLYCLVSRVRRGRAGKYRWFVLRSGVMYWFNKEQSVATNFIGLGPSCVPCNGHLKLSTGNFNLTRTQGKERGFTVESGSTSYTMFGETETDFDLWWSSIDCKLRHRRFRIRIRSMSLTAFMYACLALSVCVFFFLDTAVLHPDRAGRAKHTANAAHISVPETNYGPVTVPQNGALFSAVPQNIPTQGRPMPSHHILLPDVEPQLLQRRLEQFVPNHNARQQQQPQLQQQQQPQHNITQPADDADDPQVVIYDSVSDALAQAQLNRLAPREAAGRADSGAIVCALSSNVSFSMCPSLLLYGRC